MHDPRIDQLARQLVRYSTRIKKGEKVLIDLYDVPPAVAVAMIREVRAVKAIPIVEEFSMSTIRELWRGATEEQFSLYGRHRLSLMKKMDAYIGIRGSHNINETSDVSPQAMRVVEQCMKPTLDWRVRKTKWCVLRWPNPSMAQLAGMSTEAFEDFYFDVCLLDYAKLLPGMRALKRLMDKTDQVHIKGPGTDLRFSIKGIDSIVCGGEYNIPDGEVFTAPVRDSVEGTIRFNAPTIYTGTAFDDIELTFSKGQVVKATANNTRMLNRILDSDEGARYVGEFAIGVNPVIRHPMRDILFDEKIAGSFHFTPGQAYDEADNGNRSQIHWDMVCIQRSDYGGGEMWFDGKLIRKNGKFLPKSLASLNG